MHKVVKTLAAGALALSVVALGPSPAFANDLTCTGTISNRSVDGSVIVPNGASCTLNNVYVDGDVKSYSRSNVTINSGTVKGNVQAERSNAVVVNGTRVDGSVQSKYHTSTRVTGATVDGNIQLEEAGLNVVERNRVNGDIQLFKNTQSQRIFDNRVDGNLQCKENRHDVSGWGNIVRGNAEDQCRNLVPRYIDVPAGTQFRDDISWLGQKRITTGWDDGTYRPLTNINRDAMAAFLYRAAGKPGYTAPARSPFTDVRNGQQFYKEMSWVANKRISTGWPDGTYRSLEPVKRDAMAAFLHRADSVR